MNCPRCDMPLVLPDASTIMIGGKYAELWKELVTEKAPYRVTLYECRTPSCEVQLAYSTNRFNQVIMLRFREQVNPA